MSDKEHGDSLIPSSANDQRITNIILNHWTDIKGVRKFPKESDLDINYLEPLLDNCFLIKAEGIAEGKYNYKFLGKNIMNSYGSDLTRPIDVHTENPLTQKDKILELLENKRPVIDEGSFMNTRGDTVKYRQCLVPLSSDGFNIDSIFGGMRLKIFEKGSDE